MQYDFFQKNPQLKEDILVGIERETLRTTEEGKLSSSFHPSGLGSSLTNPYITNDFAESQIELITPPLKTNREAIDFLESLTSYLVQNTPDLLWPSSMPCILPNEEDILLATFQNHPKAREKRVYREGLVSRYGLKMQMLSAIHYNFSFGPLFFTELVKNTPSDTNADLLHKNTLKESTSSIYLQLARNFLEEGWLITYLFGASPHAHESYLKIPSLPYATSLRMSKYGYFSRTQCQRAISFNSLEEYISDLKKAVSTPFPEYKKYKKQLNDHLLQIENEHYTRIRPKTDIFSLEKEGISYVEVRSLDVNPFEATGVSLSQLDFIKNFLFYCALKPHHGLEKKEQKTLCKNQEEVALYGRKKGLKLSKQNSRVSLHSWGNTILDEMEKLLGEDFSSYRSALKNPEETLSGKILDQDFFAFNLSFANCHNLTLRKKLKKPQSQDQANEDSNKKSSSSFTSRRIDQKEIVESAFLPPSTPSYDFFEKTAKNSEEKAKILCMEKSTQFLISEALSQGIKVEILDQAESFIRLEKKGKVEYVKQATKTSKDTYVTYHLLSDKKITKKLLEENGLQVPIGKTYFLSDHQIDSKKTYLDYKLFKDKKLVVKPNETNFGLGISFIEENNPEAFQKAVEEAFLHDKQILVEEFITGKEHRFLVIDHEVVAVCERDPAHVIGDGKSTIYELVQLKNMKKEIDRIQLEQKELENIKPYTISSIPKENEKVYLRKNSNISTGGDAIDKTEEIDSKFKEIAVEAAKILRARICGVDMIIDKDQYSIIEMNYNPTITIHHAPFAGKSIPVAKNVLDCIFSD